MVARTERDPLGVGEHQCFSFGIFDQDIVGECSLFSGSQRTRVGEAIMVPERRDCWCLFASGDNDRYGECSEY